MIVENLANESELRLNKDLKYLNILNSTYNLDELYSYLDNFRNKTQYVVTFCYGL